MTDVDKALSALERAYRRRRAVVDLCLFVAFALGVSLLAQLIALVWALEALP